MKPRAGTVIQEETRNDRTEFKLKIRKQKLSEILSKRIVPPSPQTAQTALPKASLDVEVKEEQNFIKEAPGETRGKLDLNTCRKKTESQKEMLDMLLSISL